MTGTGARTDDLFAKRRRRNFTSIIVMFRVPLVLFAYRFPSYDYFNTSPVRKTDTYVRRFVDTAVISRRRNREYNACNKRRFALNSDDRHRQKVAYTRALRTTTCQITIGRIGRDIGLYCEHDNFSLLAVSPVYAAFV